MSNFIKYVRSFSTQLGWLMGILYYLSYASPTAGWKDPYLICVSIFIAFFAPYYSKFSNRIDENAAFVTASVFVGRIARFCAQYGFNIVVFWLLVRGGTISSKSLADMGGIGGIAFMISLVSQGIQYLALAFANRDIGKKNVNVTVGITVTILVGALAAQGLPFAQKTLETFGLVFGVVGLVYSLYTDLSGAFAPKGGIGLFFGTFNPAHKTHARMLKQFIKERGLSKVIVHPTLIPKVHRLALEKGQIKIKEQVNGMRIYETTEKADVHVNYFMTGNKFYEVEHRVEMLKTMVKEEGLDNIVEVWGSSEIYNKNGFYGVISAIKSKYPGRRVHGLHGSDVGGMLVRAIYDESLNIIPYAVKRVDNVSATAIRAGAASMTTPGVAQHIRSLQITAVGL